MHDEEPRIRADAARNRRAILDATAGLLAEFGYEHVTMDRVASAAGVGKGTIFHRFGSRAGLLRALALDDANALREAVTSGPPPLGPGAPAEDRLSALFDALAATVVANVELVAAVSGSALEPDANPLHEFWHEHARTLLAEVRPDTDTDMLATLLLNTLSGNAVLHLIRDGHGTRYIDSVHTLLASVLGTQPSAAGS